MDVGATDDFPDGTMRIVEVDAREVGIIRFDAEWFAVQNVCPHQNAPVCKGAIRHSLLSGTAGELIRDDARLVITCPWHGWAFDLRTGVSVTGARGRVRPYEVRVEDGRVLVEPRRGGRSA